MGHHLTLKGTFKSDKYDWCKEGFFALKLTDPVAQKAALKYAAETPDKELAADLRIAVSVARDGANEIEMEKVLDGLEIIQAAEELEQAQQEVEPYIVNCHRGIDAAKRWNQARRRLSKALGTYHRKWEKRPEKNPE